jgi:hypothetical protein
MGTFFSSQLSVDAISVLFDLIVSLTQYNQTKQTFFSSFLDPSKEKS